MNSGRIFCCQTTHRKSLTIFLYRHLISLFASREKRLDSLAAGVGLRVNCRPLTGPSAIPVRASPSTRVPSLTLARTGITEEITEGTRHLTRRRTAIADAIPVEGR